MVGFRRAGKLPAERLAALLSLAALIVFYGAFVFPSAYFRHDDWWILGNSIFHLPKDWAFLWRPSLFHNGIEQVWFFRPFFKLVVWLSYQGFGLHYFRWLAGIGTLMLLSMAIGFICIQQNTQSRSSAWLFIALWSLCIHLHFGSLFWAGEGWMNVPQLFLLTLCTWAWAKTDSGPYGTLYSVLSIVSFVLSLGFKESSVFHVVFLLALLLVSETSPEKLNKKIHTWSVLVVSALVYTVFRLGVLPLATSYKPEWNSNYFLEPLAFFLGAFGIPVLAFFALRWKQDRNAKSLLRSRADWVLAGYLLVSVAPLLGHPFFSPGWFLVPGFFLVLYLSLVAPKLNPRRLPWVLGITALVSAAPVVYKMHKLNWWSWGKAQRNLSVLFAESLPSSSKIEIRSCVNPRFEASSLERVLGFPEGLGNLWELQHARRIPVVYLPCGGHFSKDATVLKLDWQFPEIKRVDVF